MPIIVTPSPNFPTRGDARVAGIHECTHCRAVLLVFRDDLFCDDNKGAFTCPVCRVDEFVTTPCPSMMFDLPSKDERDARLTQRAFDEK